MRAELAVIGGSGFYHLLGDARPDPRPIDTPYGSPSDAVEVGELGGRSVAFLARHGRDHTLPPHRINYRANLWALASIGVQRVIAPCAVGSLRPAIARGHVVVCDQFIDRTRGQRSDTYFDGPDVAHLSAPSPYCSELRAAAVSACIAEGIPTHDRGTVAVIEGPRFATLAESHLHAQSGADVINMTQYPEVVLARELGLCYAALALVTDYDAGLAGDPTIAPVTQEEVFRVFSDNLTTLRLAIDRLIVSLPLTPTCDCAARRPHPINH